MEAVRPVGGADSHALDLSSRCKGIHKVLE